MIITTATNKINFDLLHKDHDDVCDLFRPKLANMYVINADFFRRHTAKFNIQFNANTN